MDKTNNPCATMLERLHTLEQSIYILTLVNNDLRQVVRKQYKEYIVFCFAHLCKKNIFSKPLPKFIREALKQSTISKSKATPALPLAPPPLPPTGIKQFDCYTFERAYNSI